jgi:hypothetical protein
MPRVNGFLWAEVAVEVEVKVEVGVVVEMEVVRVGEAEAEAEVEVAVAVVAVAVVMEGVFDDKDNREVMRLDEEDRDGVDGLETVDRARAEG